MNPDLPPKPDPQTGEPRPPAAPGHFNGLKEPQPYDANKVPSGPTAALEWLYGTRKSGWWSAATVVVLIIAFLTFKSGLDWVFAWPTWLFMAAAGVAFWFLPRNTKMAAGADWVNAGGDTIYTYELVEIGTSGTPGSWELILKDQRGNVDRGNIADYQQNPLLWDLVFNGIRHSVAAGATIDPETYRVLKLDEYPNPPRSRRGDIGV
ncbi:hypothetical protein [Prauserella sediminis]|uniref:hypothetical protein n=1 Tax=Prauserella sediminis TaxID=577680 RepID=UPI00160DD071|nr:hypothetical protein [Prauserella sediminis]